VRNRGQRPISFRLGTPRESGGKSIEKSTTPTERGSKHNRKKVRRKGVTERKKGEETLNRNNMEGPSYKGRSSNTTLDITSVKNSRKVIRKGKEKFRTAVREFKHWKPRKASEARIIPQRRRYSKMFSSIIYFRQ